MINVVDLYCGGGGTSQGAVQASDDVRINTAVNHWDRAIETHSGTAVCVPLLVPFDNHSGTATPRSVDDPTYTIVTKSGVGIATPVIMSGQSGGAPRVVDQPVPTITTHTGCHVAVPWITSYYGTQNTSSIPRPVNTIPCVDRHALTVAGMSDLLRMPPPRDEHERALQATMRELGVLDVGFRMLANHELAAAQSFPMGYKFCGAKWEVTKQIGNSVPPAVAEAITKSLLG